MENIIMAHEALNMQEPLFVDLRSPAEFLEANIPGSVNLPLLENEERAIVGTIYKKGLTQEAFDKGFSIIAPKLPEMYGKIKEISHEKNIVLYCWRGGMRSQSMSKLLDILGIKHFLLQGGYKGFRKLVVSYFSEPLKQQFVVLDGLTGVGKTEIIKKLRMEGMPAIDLEKLADNRGSVFGHIGQSLPPSQKQFEARLFLELLRYKNESRIIVECESKRIGSVTLPETFFQAMQEGENVLVYDTLDNRIKRLIMTYLDGNEFIPPTDMELLKDAVCHLKKRLGHKRVNYLIQLLSEGNTDEFVRTLLLDYYDPMYKYPPGPSQDYEVNLNAQNMARTTAVLKELLSKQ